MQKSRQFAPRHERSGRGAWPAARIFVTLEPCAMCAGACVNARLDRVVYGCADPKAGYVRTLGSIADDRRLNHRCRITGGVLGDECGELLTRFFRDETGSEPRHGANSLAEVTEARRFAPWEPERSASKRRRRNGLLESLARFSDPSSFSQGENPRFAGLRHSLRSWRRRRDSNPRYPLGYTGFRDRPDQPLQHPSVAGRGIICENKSVESS